MPKILYQIVHRWSCHITFCLTSTRRRDVGKKSFGSTKSGIAPFYSDKYAKIGFQVSELFDDEALEGKDRRVCEEEECSLRAFVS